MKFDVLTFSQFAGDESLLSGWEELLKTHTHNLALYSSPDWCGFFSTTDKTDDVMVIVGRDETGDISMILPVRKKIYTLKYDIYSRVLFSKKFEVAELIGGTPIAADASIKTYHQQMLNSLLTVWPDAAGLYIDVLPENTVWSNCLHSSPENNDHFLISLYGMRPAYRMKLKESMEVFLKDLGTKQRYNLKRVVKRLNKAGEVSVHQCSRPEQVETYLEAVEKISRQTWQFEKIGMHVSNDSDTRRSHTHLAQTGILRSYYLEFEGEPVAYITGHQGHGVYHQHEIGYVKSMIDMAPGMALFYSALEDLHTNNRPTHIDFGVGFADYKKRYGNEESRDESIIMFRRNLSNRFYIQSHQWFLQAIEFAKKVKGLKKPGPGKS